MNWVDIRKTYPNQWVLVEGFKPHTTRDNKREFENLAVVETCRDGASAMKKYRKMRQAYPHREFYFIHTSHDNLEIKERSRRGGGSP